MLKILLWPFSLAGYLIQLVLSAAGSILTFLLGIGVVSLGVALCATLIGAIIGVPLVLMGAGMVLRSIF